MKIYVARHGVTKHNKLKIINGQRIDEPLDPEGVEQAKEASLKLPKDITRIIASDMVRTRQTAELLNAPFNLEISYHPELREVDFGSYSGRSWTDINEEFGPEKRQSYISLAYDFTSHGGESIEMVKERIKKIFAHIKEHHANENILIVTHGGILRHIYHLCNKEKPEHIENASIHEFEI